MDLIKIAKAITSANVTDEQKRLAAPLVEAYATKFAKTDKETFNVLAVENPWFLWLDDNTLIVGVMDANRFNKVKQVYEDLELKTRRAPRIKKNGEPYKGDTEADWVAELINGAQVGIYALARHQATFVKPIPKTDVVHIRVRAAVKSEPPTIWPSRDDALYEFSTPFLAQIRAALLSASQSVRAQKLAGYLPWQLMGHWCKQYGRDCAFLPICADRKNKDYVVPVSLFNNDDPGSVAIQHGLEANKNWDEKDLVILSASAYNDYSTCAELYRLRNGGWFKGEESDALGIGTAFHAGAAQVNRELMEDK